MNIMELGALGEFVGSIAVVVTLVFLAIQVRHSKNATEANTRSTYYAFQQGLLDAEHYESGFIPAIRNMAPQWRSIGLPPMRDSFNAEVELILALDPAQIKNYSEGRAFRRQ